MTLSLLVSCSSAISMFDLYSSYKALHISSISHSNASDQVTNIKNLVAGTSAPNKSLIPNAVKDFEHLHKCALLPRDNVTFPSARKV